MAIKKFSVHDGVGKIVINFDQLLHWSYSEMTMNGKGTETWLGSFSYSMTLQKETACRCKPAGLLLDSSLVILSRRQLACRALG